MTPPPRRFTPKQVSDALLHVRVMADDSPAWDLSGYDRECLEILIATLDGLAAFRQWLVNERQDWQNVIDRDNGGSEVNRKAKRHVDEHNEILAELDKLVNLPDPPPETPDAQA